MLSHRLKGKTSCEGVDDSCPEFKNLATILEHMLSHRLKGQITWFGLEGPKEFWDFIVAACSSLPHNSIATIINMEDAKTHKAKGRAWIRSALMEKRLAEYMSHAITNSRAIRAFYGEGAYMRSDECKEMVQELEKLNTVDFSSCLKGERLETGVASVIDYTLYLKQQLSNYDMQEGSKTHQPITDATLTSPAASSSDIDIQDDEESTESKLSRLQSQFKIVCAQKNYLEEIIGHKEKGIGDALQEIQRYQQTMRILEQQARHDRQYWEKLVLDLQDQIASLKEAQMVSRRELEEHLISGHSPRVSNVGTYTDPEIALDKLENMVLEVMPDNDSLQSGGELSPDGTTSIGSPEHSSLTSSVRTDDQRSEDRYASAGSLQVSQKLEKEPTPSLVPLAGSFSSQMSLRSSETNWSSSANVHVGDATNTYSQTNPLQDGASVSSESGVSSGEGQPLTGNT
ncbi:RUN domain-containing protein 3B-like isoform X1 [Amphiura filiformis]|uniref:RUN domain-containing protein 3B-like isoform X1 n=1 Tax=Amphiura filiformis TaxID=82378 RepID=UPI003B21700B